MKPSATKLGKILKELSVVDEAFTARDLKKGDVKGVSNETYGKDSRVYVHCDSNEERRRIERILQRKYNVTTVHTDYWPGSGTLEVSVTYFKGARHWE